MHKAVLREILEIAGVRFVEGAPLTLKMHTAPKRRVRASQKGVQARQAEAYSRSAATMDQKTGRPTVIMLPA
jgi:hypothetical protein